VPADEDQRVRLQPLEQDFELGPEETRVPAFGDPVVVRAHSEFGGDLGAGVALEQVDVLGSVEFPPKVHEVAPVSLLEEHDRNAVLACLGYKAGARSIRSWYPGMNGSAAGASSDGAPP
jgi:hypothetical protein